MHLWDAATGEGIAIYRDHVLAGVPGQQRVYSVAWSPDGTRIVSGGIDDATTLIWQVVP